MSKRKKIETLSIRLLREECEIKDSFNEKFKARLESRLDEFLWHDIEDAKLFMGSVYKNKYKWLDFIKEGFEGLPSYPPSEGLGAVIFLPVRNRTLAVCFGNIHIALNDNAFEKQFGIKVTLNSVPKNQIKTLDIATPDAVTFKKSIQASKDSDLHKFGIDIRRDLAQVAGGTPLDKSFAKYIVGKDILSITCEVTPSSIHKKCYEIYDQYIQTTYTNDFPWFDNFRCITDKDLVKKLDDRLFEELKNSYIVKDTSLHIDNPDITDHFDKGSVRYIGFGSRKKEFQTLSIEDYISELIRCKFDGPFSDLKKNHKVSLSGLNGNPISKRRIYDYFIFETDLASKSGADYYILYAGQWYCINRSFKNEIDRLFDLIPKINLIGKTNCKNEEDLIAYIDTTRSDLIKLDREKINPKGEKNANLEPCDFISEKNEFIHLKNGNSSSLLSHLWMQGLVSAKTFLNDLYFRTKLKTIIHEKNEKFKFNCSIEGVKDRDQYTIVYGIMRKRYVNGSIGLPFFSKVSLITVVENIKNLGMNTALELIEKIP